MSGVTVNIGSVDGVTVATVAGTIDGASAPAAQAQLEPLLQPGGRFVLAMDGVEYMSSAGLRMMLMIYRQVNGRGGKVVLTGLPSDIRDTMMLTGFLDFFTTADTTADGVAAVREG
jgi:anti-sigma B factor antagonist